MLTVTGLQKNSLIPFKNFNCVFLELSRPPYNYQPLEGLTHIRLLHLEDGGRAESLRCKIEQVDLAQRPSFQAISYVWGSSEKPWWIELDDGSRIYITASLHSVLRDLRSVCKGKSKIFWADAICINQADIIERSKQVQLMDKIYGSASKVITYIGPGSSTVYSGLDLARQLLDYAETCQNEPMDPRRLSPAFQRELGFPDEKDPRWKALGSLLKRGWPTRVWMVQEFLLNKEVSMLCGQRFLPWNTFTQLPRLAVDGDIPGGFLGKSTVSDKTPDSLSVLDVLRTEREGNPDLKMTMLELLQWCHVMSSTDPRDKVYAVLGLACDLDRLGIIPDYSIDAAEVYRNTTVRILETHQTLDIFGSAHKCNQSPNELLRLPSWVPDWSSWSDDNPVPLVHDATFSRLNIYDACAGAKSKIKFDAQKSQLIVQGLILDQITFTSGRLDILVRDPANTFYQLKALFNQLHNWKESLSQAEADEIFWRTLIANIVYEQREASPEVGEWYLAYVELLRWNAAFCRGKFCTAMSEKRMVLAHKFMIAMITKAERRSLCTTEKNYLCLTPPDAKIGDKLCILSGGRVPYLLRKASGDTFTVVGECYVHGLMKGAVFKDKAMRDLIEDIKLV